MSIPIHALFAADQASPNDALETDPRELISTADIVIAVDVMTRNKSLVYGRRILEGIIASGKSKPVVVLPVELDMETDELERLLVLLEIVKGHHDYASSV